MHTTTTTPAAPSTPTPQRRLRARRAAAAIAAIAVTATLSACSSPAGETTCAEFAAMSSADRDDVLENMLRENDLEPLDSGNVIGIRENVQNYCGFLLVSEGAQPGQNADQPLDNAVDWSSSTW